MSAGAGAARSWLVSGATGLVGGRLCRSLLADGVQVRTLTRDLARASGRLDPRVLLVRWDGSRVPAESVEGCDAVVHLAGEPVFRGRLSRARRERIRASRVDSTRSLVTALGALDPDQRPRVLVCASAIGYYGEGGERELAEDAPAATGFLADLCRAWEAAAAEAAPLGVRAVSLRIGLVLAAEGGPLPAMALPFRVGLGGRLGSGEQWVPWVHADDLTALIRHAVETPGLGGPVNAVAPAPVRNRELTVTLARALRRPALLPVPAFALRLALGELARELLSSRRVVPRAARESGFVFRHPELGAALAEELG